MSISKIGLLKLWGVADRLYVLYNSIDISRYELYNKNDKTKENMFTVAYSGRITEEKGVYELVKAVMELCKKGMNIKLIVMGCCWFPDVMETPYMDKIQSLQFDKTRIVFTGFLGEDKMAKYYSLSDVICIPSKWNEPFGMVALEAMASCKMIITTSTGGLSEIVDNGCAVYVDVANLEKDLESAIETAYHNRDMCIKMGMNGYKKIKNTTFFQKESYYSNFIKCYDGKDKDFI